MNVKAQATVERHPVEGPGWTRATSVSVEVVLTDGARGDAVVGALDSAWAGARRVVVDSLDKTL